MTWYKERVWQMGIGTLLVLLGALITYLAAAGEQPNAGLMWVGLAFIFFGLLIPLFAKFAEATQEKEGERGEC